MTATNYMAQVEAIFRRMLSKGVPVALEDAAKCVETPEGVDRRCFGSIPRHLKKDGVIIDAGFRLSREERHNSGIKRLWILVDQQGGEQ
jgi:hypothetical protein